MGIIKLQSIKPSKLPSGADYSKAIEAAVQKSAALVLRDLEATTRTWKHKPAFDVTITRTGENYSVSAGTDSLIYGYVDAGTKPHVIRPKRSKYLRFSSGYRAKTRVGIIGSNPGGAFGSDVYSKSVNHPGTKARGFIKAIQKRRQVTIQQEVSQAIAKVNREQK